ncbi:MAG: TspO/MBR family protein [Minisyncoccia bacterium]
MDSYSSYQTLKRPQWAPPAWVFGPVWTVLYLIITVSFGTVFYRALTGAVPLAVALPFALNLIFNFAYTWLQFGRRKYVLASVDVILVLGTLLWALTLRSSLSEVGLVWVLYANIPYLAWVFFATVLQMTVTYLNR